MGKTRLVCLLLALSPSAFGQANHGELRLKVTDPAGLGVRTAVQIVSEANQYRNTLNTDAEGNLIAQRLPYGIYNIEIQEPGFATLSQTINVQTSVPMDYNLQLKLSAVGEVVNVNAANTLVNPDEAGSVSQIGLEDIQDRVTSVPGRSMQDLVNDQPGWLYEGNAVLHPRGSEYQTQFVVDGIPLTDNRSPGFGPEMEADDVQSVSIYTAGIPAEYGRKMGGVVEVNTLQDVAGRLPRPVVLSGGSFDTAGVFAQGQYVWGKNTLGASASGSRTDHYLNPVVPQNYTNAGTLGDFSVHYERDFTPQRSPESHRPARIVALRDSERASAANSSSRPVRPIPAPRVAAGKRRTTFETMGIASYQHTFSPNVVADFRGMVRDNENDFNSNADSTPDRGLPAQWFREGYFKGTITVTTAATSGSQASNPTIHFLNENFRYSHHRPDAVRSRHSARLLLSRKPPRSRAVRIRAGLIRLATGRSAPDCAGTTTSFCEPEGSESALVNFALLPVRRFACCISPTTGFFRRLRSKTFCFPAPPRSNRSTPRISCGCRCSLPKEITTKRE